MTLAFVFNAEFAEFLSFGWRAMPLTQEDRSLNLGGSAHSAFRTKQVVEPVPKGRKSTGRGGMKWNPCYQRTEYEPRRGERAHLFVLSPRRGSCGVAIRCRGQDPCLYSHQPFGLFVQTLCQLILISYLLIERAQPSVKDSCAQIKIMYARGHSCYTFNIFT